MNELLIEVSGTSVNNAGAELMLASIQSAVKGKIANPSFAVDSSFGSYEDRARYGLKLKQEIQRIGRSRLSLALMPSSFRKMLGVVRDREIQLVLDASGFAFGDQHPVARSEEFATQAEDWRNQGTPLVLLPQAMGPFEEPAHRASFARIAAAADLMYARDEVSKQHAIAAGADPSKVRLAPDFTVLLKAAETSLALPPASALIVPNQRMIDTAVNATIAKRYIEWLVEAVQHCRKRNLVPWLLLHGSDDVALADSLSSLCDSPVPQIDCRDPLEAKGFLGQARLVIGSRYHALIGALSQGVPTLATSWSHKYEALFAEYGVTNWLLPPAEGNGKLEMAIDNILDDHDQHRAHLDQRARAHRQRSREMWDEVVQWIESSTAASARPNNS